MGCLLLVNRSMMAKTKMSSNSNLSNQKYNLILYYKPYDIANFRMLILKFKFGVFVERDQTLPTKQKENCTYKLK